MPGVEYGISRFSINFRAKTYFFLTHQNLLLIGVITLDPYIIHSKFLVTLYASINKFLSDLYITTITLYTEHTNLSNLQLTIIETIIIFTPLECDLLTWR